MEELGKIDQSNWTFWATYEHQPMLVTKAEKAWIEEQIRIKSEQLRRDIRACLPQLDDE